jgi:hypothetical protein
MSARESRLTRSGGQANSADARSTGTSDFCKQPLRPAAAKPHTSATAARTSCLLQRLPLATGSSAIRNFGPEGRARHVPRASRTRARCKEFEFHVHVATARGVALLESVRHSRARLGQGGIRPERRRHSRGGAPELGRPSWTRTQAGARVATRRRITARHSSIDIGGYRYRTAAETGRRSRPRSATSSCRSSSALG